VGQHRSPIYRAQIARLPAKEPAAAGKVLDFKLPFAAASLVQRSTMQASRRPSNGLFVRPGSNPARQD